VIAILADDLTSALDGAAPFADRGLKAKVVFDSRGLADVDTDVLSLDLDSRFAAAPVAEQRFRLAGAALAHARLLYKTMDSTLRGNLCPEARGAMAGSGRPRALVAPAFPAAGRATLGGRQFVQGVPVERTEFARDALNPVSSSLVADHFAGLGASAFRVCDAAHDSELDALVFQTGLDADLVWIGSPGLAAALARAVPAAERSPAPWPAVGRVLIVVGSRHPANAAQIDGLKAAGAVMVAATSTLSSPQTSAQAVLGAFSEADVVCLVAPQASVEAQGRTSAELARWLGEVVSLSTSAFEGLVVTGGDTARRIADALGARSMDLAGEVQAGVPFGWLHTPRGGFAFATKAGGFGDPNTLLRCVDALRTHGERAA
jgi:uncharacterized protein YgbK (DUF1537 family)